MDQRFWHNGSHLGSPPGFTHNNPFHAQFPAAGHQALETCNPWGGSTSGTQSFITLNRPPCLPQSWSPASQAFHHTIIDGPFRQSAHASSFQPFGSPGLCPDPNRHAPGPSVFRESCGGVLFQPHATFNCASRGRDEDDFMEWTEGPQPDPVLCCPASSLDEPMEIDSPDVPDVPETERPALGRRGRKRRWV